MMKMLDEAAVSYRLVLTKADKIKASELEAVIAATEAEARKHPAAHPEIIATSSETGLGMDALRRAVLEAPLVLPGSRGGTRRSGWWRGLLQLWMPLHHASAVPLPRLRRPGEDCLIAHQRQHFAPAAFVLAEDAHHPAGGHHHAGGVDAAGGHAGVAGLDHHGDALGLEMLADAVGDLGGEPFLDLQPPGEAVEDAGELRDADHPVVRADRRSTPCR